MPDLKKTTVTSTVAVFFIDKMLQKPPKNTIKINLLNTGVWIDSDSVYRQVLKTVKKHIQYYQK